MLVAVLDNVSVPVWLPLFLVSLGAAHILLLYLISATIVMVHAAFLPLISSSLEVIRSVPLLRELHLANVVLVGRVTARRIVAAAAEVNLLGAQQSSADHGIAILLIMLAIVRHERHRLMVVAEGAAAVRTLSVHRRVAHVVVGSAVARSLRNVHGAIESILVEARRVILVDITRHLFLV